MRGPKQRVTLTRCALEKSWIHIAV